MKVGKRAGGDREGPVQLRSVRFTQPQSLMIPGVNPRGWDHTRSEGKCCHLVPLEKFLKNSNKKSGLSWWSASPAVVSVLPVQSYRPLVVFFLFKGVTILHGIWKTTLWRYMLNLKTNRLKECILRRSAQKRNSINNKVLISINNNSINNKVVFKAGDFRKYGFKQSPLDLRITQILFILMKLCIFTPRDCKMLFYHKTYIYLFYYCVSEETWSLYSTSEKEPRNCSLLSDFVKKFNRTRI